MKIDLLMKIALVAASAYAAEAVKPAVSSSSVQVPAVVALSSSSVVVASSSSSAVSSQAASSAVAPSAATPAPVVAPIAPAPVVAPVAPTPAPVVVPAPKIRHIVAMPPMVAPAKKKSAEESDININGRIDIQGTKVLWSEMADPNNNNLESWFGRGQISLDAKTSDYEGKLTIRAYPTDFGTTVVSKIDSVPVAYLKDTTLIRLVNGTPTYPDTAVTRTKNVATPVTKNVDQFQLYEAWTQFKGSFADLKLGRYWVNDRVGMAFGDYAAEGSGAQFMPAGLQVNAIELSHTWFENVFGRVALESNDPNLNKGTLRAALKLDHLAGIEWLRVGLNYSNDMFKVIKYVSSDTLVIHNASASVELPLADHFRIFTELGLRGMTSNGNSPNMPITFGAEIPGGRAFDKVLLEGEFDNDRAAVNGKVKKTIGSLFLQKNLGSRFQISFGVQNYNNTEDFGMIGRLTALID